MALTSMFTLQVSAMFLLLISSTRMTCSGLVLSTCYSFKTPVQEYGWRIHDDVICHYYFHRSTALAGSSSTSSESSNKQELLWGLSIWMYDWSWLRRRLFEFEKPSGHQQQQVVDVDVDCCSCWGVIFCCVLLLTFLLSLPFHSIPSDHEDAWLRRAE